MFILNWLLNNWSTVIFIIIFAYFFFKKKAILLAAEKNPQNIDFHEIQSIPNGFTTLGVLGTFVGIVLGLAFFKVENIEASVPALLSGMTTAFLTSVMGLAISMYFSKRIKTLFYKLEQAEKESHEILLARQILNENKQSSQFLSVLQSNSNLFKDFFNTESFGKLLASIAAIPISIENLADGFKVSIAQQTNGLRTAFAELVAENKAQTAELASLNTKLLDLLDENGNQTKELASLNTKLVHLLNENGKQTAGLASLKAELMSLLTENKAQTAKFSTIQTSLENHHSAQIQKLSAQIQKLGELKIELVAENKAQTTKLGELKTELLAIKQNTSSTAKGENNNELIVSIKETNQTLLKKFDEFAKAMAEQNMNALVKGLEKVVTDFNATFQNLIKSLVSKNFEELNQSVRQLNDWQQNNVKQVEKLTLAFNNSNTQLSDKSLPVLNATFEKMQIAATTLSQIVEFEKTLVGNAGLLQQLSAELKKLMQDDSKFTKMSENLFDAALQSQKNTTKLNEWQQNSLPAMQVLLETLIQSINANKILSDKSLPTFEKTFIQIQNTATELYKVVEFEKTLVGNAGLLQQLSAELKKVMQDDTKFDKVANHLIDAADKMSAAMQTLDNWKNIVNAFNNSANQLETSASLLQKVSNFENQLIGNSGVLKTLIVELQQVMSADRNLLKLVNNAADTSDALKIVTTSLTTATTSLNTTAAKYQTIEAALNGLGGTMQNVKTNIDLFTTAFILMRDQLENVTNVELNEINQQFLNNLNTVFVNLDKLFAKYTELVDKNIKNK